ncbi:hypothetical protein ACWCQZ_48665 [Streptomyces sp. NPDC002285]
MPLRAEGFCQAHFGSFAAEAFARDFPASVETSIEQATAET